MLYKELQESEWTGNKVPLIQMGALFILKGRERIMDVFDSLFNRFSIGEFSIQPNKKLKSLTSEFQKTFRLTLVVYEGGDIANEDLTLAGFNKRFSKNINLRGCGWYIGAQMKIGAVEKLFEKHFCVSVQIKDDFGQHIIPKEFTLEEAARKIF